MSISFFTLIAGSTGKLNKYVGCQTEFKGILKYWDDIDIYLQKIDQLFCNDNDDNGCQCVINEYTDKIFKDDPIIGFLYTNLYQNTKKIVIKKIGAVDYDNDAISWRKCSQKAIKNSNSALDREMRNIDGFEPKIFNRFWEHIENKFDCTGFCSTVYQYTGQTSSNNDALFKQAPLQMPMFKYLFSDINRGIPKHRGCMKPILDWLPKMLISFGSFALFAALVQFGLFILSISLLGASSSDDANKPKSQVYQKQDENRQLNEERK